MFPYDLVAKLEKIWVMKNSLPFRSRGHCNELGLYVQLRAMKGMARLQAGGKYRAQIDLWRIASNEPWQIKKYRSGAWEALVEPTQELVEWLAERGGLAGPIQNEFREAISAFRATGHLVLPQGVMSFPAQSELGRILPVNPRDLGVKWAEIAEKLHAYIEAHPSHAAAWDALRIVYVQLQRFAEALHAGAQAIIIAPEDGKLHFEVALLYLAAVTNAVRESRGTEGGDPELQGCTLSALGCTYAMARSASRKHFEVVLASYTSEDYKKVAAEMYSGLGRIPES